MWQRILFRLQTLATISTLPRQQILNSRIHIPNFSIHFSKSIAASICTRSATTISSPDDADDGIQQDGHDEFLQAAETPEKLDPQLLHSIESIITSLRDFSAGSAAAKLRLEHCGVTASPELVTAVLSRLRNDWAAAFTFFLWAGAQPGYSHSVREYHAMISILGKMRRFDTAWSLVQEMRRGAAGPPLLTPHAILILIRRYCAVHDVARAINAFHMLKKFGFTPGIEDFHGLLSALCRYKNVEDAEHLLLCNEKTFRFETKSFNIILNGWCSVVVRVREAKRFWRDMANRGIRKDVVSYGSMISCYSKAGNLNDVLKLFNRMKEMGIEADRKVYNAVIYALAKAKCVEEAKRLMGTMEEKGITPNAVTFNSLIRPLCKVRKLDDAKKLFDEMLRRGLLPCVRTYHAFFDLAKNVEEVFELLRKMEESGCFPAIETYIMLIRKLSRWRQHESVFRLWNEMPQNGLTPDRSAYVVLIHGLFLNGKLEEASTYYEEMKAKGFLSEPKTEEMIQAWLSGKVTGQLDIVGLGRNQDASASVTSMKHKRVSRKEFPEQPGTRKITRERGFSLYDS